jgi:hypothetical protein
VAQQQRGRPVGGGGAELEPAVDHAQACYEKCGQKHEQAGGRAALLPPPDAFKKSEIDVLVATDVAARAGQLRPALRCKVAASLGGRPKA